MGVDRVHFSSNVNEAAKLLKVKVDLKLRWSLLCHGEVTGSELKWQKQPQNTANWEGHPLSHLAGFLLGLRLGEERCR